MMNNKRVIRAAGIAKKLLSMGHVVVSTCPQRDNPAGSCFVFYKDRWLNEDIDAAMNTAGTGNVSLQNRLDALGMTETEYRQNIFSACLRDGGFNGT